MSGRSIEAWLVWGICLCSHMAAVAPVRAQNEDGLDGAGLGFIPAEQTCYEVKQTHVLTGGPLSGSHRFSFRLRLGVDGKKLKTHPRDYEGTGIVPVLARIEGFEYESIRPGGKECGFKMQRYLDHRLDWVETDPSGKAACGCARVVSNRDPFPHAQALYLGNVWLPALHVRFPEAVAVREGAAWGGEPGEAPDRYEDLSRLQRWTISKVEKMEEGFILTMSAECRGGPDENGRTTRLRREVVYDTGRQLTVRASVVFEAERADRTERIELAMDIAEEG